MGLMFRHCCRSHCVCIAVALASFFLPFVCSTECTHYYTQNKVGVARNKSRLEQNEVFNELWILHLFTVGAFGEALQAQGDKEQWVPGNFCP